MSNSLRPHGLQHSRLPCPSPPPGACSNSCQLSQWRRLTISSSVIHFSSCLQSFPAPGSFLMSWLFASSGQSIEVSISASVLPMNIQNWFHLGLTGLISFQSKGLSRESGIELEESTFLTSDYTTELQSSRQYGTGTKKKYRPMEQDRKPRNKPMHLLVPYFWQRRQKYAMRQRQHLQ